MIPLAPPAATPLQGRAVARIPLGALPKANATKLGDTLDVSAEEEVNADGRVACARCMRVSIHAGVACAGPALA
jgi:hypothetical protein